MRSRVHAGASGVFHASSGALALVALFLAFAAPASAHGYLFGEIAVGHIWAPPVEAREGNVYGSLLNQGYEEDRLLAASTAAAERVVFRFGDETAARASILLPPGKPVSLAAWGYHLYLSGLARPLKIGESFELTLTFEKAGAHSVRIVVEPQPGQ